MPDWVADEQARLDKIREAKAELEAEAKAKRRLSRLRVRRMMRATARSRY
jgi:hypothetical protein